MMKTVKQLRMDCDTIITRVEDDMSSDDPTSDESEFEMSANEDDQTTDN